MSECICEAVTNKRIKQINPLCSQHGINPSPTVKCAMCGRSDRHTHGGKTGYIHYEPTEKREECRTCSLRSEPAVGWDNCPECGIDLSKREDGEGWEDQLEVIILEAVIEAKPPVTGFPLKQLEYKIKSLISSLLKSEEKRVRGETLKLIDPFDLVQECNPDCTPEEHAYHKGTWDSFLKLERTLKQLEDETL